MEDLRKGLFDVCGIEGRCLQEEQSILFSKITCNINRNGTKVLQVTLVSNEHDDTVGLSALLQAGEPRGDVGKGGGLGDVVNEECAFDSAVVAIQIVE